MARALGPSGQARAQAKPKPKPKPSQPPIYPLIYMSQAAGPVDPSRPGGPPWGDIQGIYIYIFIYTYMGWDSLGIYVHIYIYIYRRTILSGPVRFAHTSHCTYWCFLHRSHRKKLHRKISAQTPSKRYLKANILSFFLKRNQKRRSGAQSTVPTPVVAPGLGPWPKWIQDTI